VVPYLTRGVNSDDYKKPGLLYHYFVLGWELFMNVFPIGEAVDECRPFLEDGVHLAFQLRIIILAVFFFLYLLSPLDLVPEVGLQQLSLSTCKYVGFPQFSHRKFYLDIYLPFGRISVGYFVNNRYCRAAEK